MFALTRPPSCAIPVEEPPATSAERSDAAPSVLGLAGKIPVCAVASSPVATVDQNVRCAAGLVVTLNCPLAPITLVVWRHVCGFAQVRAAAIARLHGVVGGPLAAVDPQEAALEPEQERLVDQVEKVERRDRRVALDEADQVGVVARLRRLVDERHVLPARVQLRVHLRARRSSPAFRSRRSGR